MLPKKDWVKGLFGSDIYNRYQYLYTRPEEAYMMMKTIMADYDKAVMETAYVRKHIRDNWNLDKVCKEYVDDMRVISADFWKKGVSEQISSLMDKCIGDADEIVWSEFCQKLVDESAIGDNLFNPETGGLFGAPPGKMNIFNHLLRSGFEDTLNSADPILRRVKK